MCPDGCYGHGKCIEIGWTEGTLTSELECECFSGFSGFKCHRSVRPVAQPVSRCPGACSGHGVCDLETYTCTCLPGFEGPACSQLSDEAACSSLNRCSGQGRCELNAMSLYECVCQEGFTGDDCATAVDMCVCRHGSCVADDEVGHKCSCDSGFTGAQCDDYRRGLDTLCHAVDFCSGKGQCYQGTCACHDSFVGTSDCSVEVPGGICPSSCSGRGVCDDITQACVCNVEWTGEACDVSRCEMGVVNLAGSLGNSSNSSNLSQYSAANLSTSVCSSHGVCKAASNVSTDVNCSCDNGYESDDCSTPPCPGGCVHGTCVFDNVTRASSCACPDGWYGARCSRSGYGETDKPCCPKDCAGQGVCVDCVCDCAVGFQGTSCEEVVVDEDDTDGLGL